MLAFYPFFLVEVNGTFTQLVLHLNCWWDFNSNDLVADADGALTQTVLHLLCLWGFNPNGFTFSVHDFIYAHDFIRYDYHTHAFTHLCFNQHHILFMSFLNIYIMEFLTHHKTHKSPPILIFHKHVWKLMKHHQNILQHNSR
jgi:hypothetical protein